MATQDPSTEVPAVVLSAAQRVNIGEFRRAFVRVKKARFKPDTVEFTLYEFAEGIVFQSATEPERASAFAWRGAVRVYLAGLVISGGGKHTLTYSYSMEMEGGGSLKVGGKVELRGKYQLTGRGKPPDSEQELYVRLSESQQRVSQRLLPLARAALADGKKVLFDKVKVGNTGLYTEDGLIPWSAITSVKVADGHVTVRVEGRGRLRPALNLSMYELPNSPLFMTLVNDMMQAR
ncbi:hypothetical protein ABH935_008371 [Catenulispora sp. GAS73]|uniref:DUF6585 family protein n=1 Tax=Catenulispora sp. GAS73 TaxID=3156269 RepID=UPI003511F6BA